MSWLTSKNIISIIVSLSFLCPYFVFAQVKSICSSNGYTIFTINGMNTDIDRAIENRDKLLRKISGNYNNQPLTVEFIHNPSHIAGLGDVTDVIDQKLYEDSANLDFDFLNMWKDASEKLRTQKVLFVGHSQGNFYTNIFYNTLANKVDGIPNESLGVYGVASPANYVAGDGKYITSSEDSVINKIRTMNLLNVLPANVIIEPSFDDPSGHGFTEVYLEYQGNRIVSEIRSSFDKLKENNIQDENEPCIAAPELTTLHKITGVGLAIADPLASGTKTIAVNTIVVSYKVANAVGNGVLTGVTVTTVTTYNTLSFIGNSVLNGVSSVASTVSSVVKSLTKNTNTNINDLGNINTASVILANTPKDIPQEQDPEQDLMSENIINNPEEKITTTEETPPYTREIVSEITNTISPIPTVIVLPGGAGGDGWIDTSLASPPPEPPILPPPEPPVPPPTPPAPPPPIPDTTAPIITVLGDSPTAIKRDSIYTDLGATALDAVDGTVSVVTTGVVDTSTLGTYTLTYTATDAAGNTSTLTRDVNVSTYVYIPKFKFGTGNGDGNDWQAWFFNSSYIYDWSSTYVDHYLKEDFKFQMILSSYCSNCLEMGIFNHNPQLGFEPGDVSLSSFQGSPQFNQNNSRYESSMQWDATGYSYTTLENGLPYLSGHVSPPNMNQNLWIGWDGTSNSFHNFAYGFWMGIGYPSAFFPASQNHAGGSDMVLETHPVYIE